MFLHLSFAPYGTGPLASRRHLAVLTRLLLVRLIVISEAISDANRIFRQAVDQGQGGIGWLFNPYSK
jgi:hypothetical protein